MSRKAFQQGLSLFQEGRYQDALQHFTEALNYDIPNKYLILDSRSSTYLRLGETKKALQDAKQTINLAPERWQGYARAARVFFQFNKLDASLTMVDMAISRLREEDAKRHESLVSLKVEVEAAQRALEARRQRFIDHMGKLPIELFSEIASIVVAENQMSPIVLSHVSRQWRGVIHNLPRLWDTLVLTRKRPVQKTKLWMEKSRGKIRELSIRSSVFDVPWAGNHLDLLEWEYLRVLKVQRWDNIISLRLLRNLSSLINIEHFETDGIFKIHLCPFVRRDQGRDDDADSKLRYLCIDLESKDLIVEPFGVQRLTSLTLFNVTLCYDILEFLDSNPNLEHLFLQSVHSTSTSKKAILPNLKTLSLKFMVPAAISDLELPSLEVLRIDTLPVPADILSLFRSLVDKNSSHLTQLTIRSTSLPYEAVLSLLRISNSLQILEISNVSSLAPQVIEALGATTATSNSPTDPDPSTVSQTLPTVICPRLTSIDFSSCPDVETGPLVRLVRSRCSNDADVKSEIKETSFQSPIMSLSMDFCPRIDSTWLQWFRKRVPQVSCVYMKKNAKFRAS